MFPNLSSLQLSFRPIRLRSEPALSEAEVAGSEGEIPLKIPFYDNHLHEIPVSI
ncbi:hypothetical protein MNBD_CHLOROFLEXI01-1546 [hydrothermal vent metagenome]|uniref:Uncharacterized protein n=1 Tax=hydrothermal vent metagenome TaxID=652676 RepID=A0A3B0VLH3_9ZZZZ